MPEHRARLPAEARYPELPLCVIGLSTAGALAWRRGSADALAIETIVATALLLAGSRLLGRAGSKDFTRWRGVLIYLFALWYYTTVARFVPALGLTTFDRILLNVDRLFFGETPAVAL